MPHTASVLTPDDLAQLRELWRFAEPRLARLGTALVGSGGSPEREAALSGLRAQREAEGLGSSLALERAALFEDRWEPYLGHLNRLGARYAESGIGYSAWFELVIALRDGMRELVSDYVEEDAPTRRPLGSPVTRGVNRLLDIVVESIVEGYLASKEERTRAESEHARDRLRETEAQLHRAQKLDAVGRLAGSVAHDFNNVLTVVESYAWILEESFESADPRRADIVEIRRAAERAGVLTRQLLALSRHSITALQSVLPDEVIAGFVPMLRRLVGEHVDLVVHRGTAPNVIADPGHIEQVLMNLAINARDAMGERGRVTIETSDVEIDAEEAAARGGAPGHFAVIAVTDTGSGMDAETQRRIFDPFFTTKEAGKGTGLGLSIVHGIVTQAGGSIEVYSERGQGTTFRVKLPAALDGTPARPVHIEGPAPELPPLTVLVVDEQEDVRRVASRILTQAGCAVLLASTSAEARKVCVSHDGTIDVALLDVILSDGRGDLIAAELRSLRPELEIVLMSGYPAGALGPTGTVPANLVAKPFTPSKLRAAIARVAGAVGEPKRRSEPSLPSRVLVADDDPTLRRMLVRFLRKVGYEVHDVDTGRAAIAALETGRFDVVLSDVHMPDGSGLDILRAARRVDLDVPVILISGMPDVETASKALEYGAFRYLTKPLDLQAVDKLVRHGIRAHALARLRREAMSVTGAASGAADRAGVEVRFESALDQLYMVFQPIVHASTGELFGVEALMRTREPSMPHPGAILDAATTLGRLAQLGRRVRTLSGLALAARPDIGALFVNLHPDDLLDIDLLDPAAALTGIAPRVILEVTERSSLTTSTELSSRLARIRKLGFRVAVDDIGAGYSGLTSFADLIPEVVKIDMSLVRDVHASTLKQRTIAALCNLCHEVGAMVVGEGVETEAEREQLVALGCDLLQGYLIAKPHPELPAPRAPRLEPSTPAASGRLSP